MKKAITIILIVLTVKAYTQDQKCKAFRVGKFSYSDPDYGDLLTERNDSIQTDAYPSMGWKITSEIKWLSDCKYQTTCIKVNNKMLESLIGAEFVIEIVQIMNNKILCRTESQGIVVEKEMTKIQSD